MRPVRRRINEKKDNGYDLWKNDGGIPVIWCDSIVPDPVSYTHLDDPCATKVTKDVFGVNVVMTDMDVKGDLLHEDTTREMWVMLNSTQLTGAIQHANVAFDKGSKWVATADSDVVFVTDVEPVQIDAPTGVTITAKGAQAGEFALAGGGTLVVTA